MARSATAKLKVNPPVGRLPVLQYCAPDELNIDESYQRSLDVAASQTLIRKIAMYWDWGLCQPLFVARRDDGRLYVVDGQHRLAAARLRGDIWQLPCVVSSFASAAEEAASFVALNQMRRPLNRLQLYRAAVAGGDPEAIAIQAALEANGLWIGSSPTLKLQKPGALTCVAALENCLRAHGPGVLLAALNALAQSFKGQVLSYSGTIFPGIAAIVASECKADPNFVDSEMFSLMIEMVGGATQAQWREDIDLACAAAEASSRRQAAVQVFTKAWAECREALLDEAA